MNYDEAVKQAKDNAARTGEQWAVCDDIEGRLFVVPADCYKLQQLYLTDTQLGLANSSTQ